MCDKYMFHNQYVSFAASDLSENDQITKVNNTKIRNIDHLSTVLDSSSYHANKKSSSKFIVLHTTNDEHVLNLDMVSEAERELNTNLHVTLPLRFLRKDRNERESLN